MREHEKTGTTAQAMSTRDSRKQENERNNSCGTCTQKSSNNPTNHPLILPHLLFLVHDMGTQPRLHRQRALVSSHNVRRERGVRSWIKSRRQSPMATRSRGTRILSFSLDDILESFPIRRDLLIVFFSELISWISTKEFRKR